MKLIPVTETPTLEKFTNSQPDNETPFQRFQRLAKRIVTAPKPPVEKPKPS